MTENNQDGAGIVKKLFFPGYTEAGSNDAFGKQDIDAIESVLSEAPTEVHNNLSTKEVVSDENVHSEAQQVDTVQPRNWPLDEADSQPPPFFSSTKPSALQPQDPESPPKLPRMHIPPPVRSLSTRATVNDEDAASPNQKSLFDETERDSDAPDDEFFSDISERIGPRPQRSATPPTVETNETEKEEEEDVYPIDERKDGTEPLWEEEATPAQTAFGKELMFRRDEYKKLCDGSSDVLSTASEMGTVISTGERMAEVDQMRVRSTSQSPIEPATPRPQYYSDPDPIWEDERLALPTLENGRPSESKREDEEEKKIAENETAPEDQPSAKAILSKAFRRIGSGLTGSQPRSSMSAPSTPSPAVYSQAPHGPGKYNLSPRHVADDQTAPSSFLLRSPGSKAHAAAHSSAKKDRRISPCVSNWQKDTKRGRRSNGSIPEDGVTKDGLTKRSQALQIARSCFSYDAYDTSMDDFYEFQIPNMEASPERRSRQQNTQVLGPSTSWDVSGASRAPAFRPRHRVRDYTSAFASPRQGPSTVFGSSSFASPGRRPVSTFGSSPSRQGSLKQRPQRVRIASDYSPPTNDDSAVELKTPQRIEIEREDALDILMCLVERGISLKDPPAQDGEAALEMESGVEKPAERQLETIGSLDLAAAVAELRKVCETEAGDLDDESRRIRLQALNELVRSHEYALEMRRAAQSASSWLKSIGRSQTEKISGDREIPQDPTSDKLVADGKDSSESMDLITAKAMLHSAQMELEEKAKLAERMNEELANCRAEIGRLKSAAHGAQFRSPNRSILDDSAEYSREEEEDEDDQENEEVGDRAFGNASPVSGAKETEFLDISFPESDTLPFMAEDKNKQAELQSALDKANDIIRKLHTDLKSREDSNEDIPDEPPIVELESVVNEDERPENSDKKTVNVRMLDGENFVTEWDDLASLPPPPDHGLRSPIVAAVLEQWSDDSALHESLISWIEQVLVGGDPDTIPPLTISSLDHQVRDGFTMHVLPLLLRRPDIRVDVKSRIHRRTTYDLSVSVDSVRPGALDLRRHLETTSAKSDVGASSVTHSTATALIANTGGASRYGIQTAKSFPDDVHEGGDANLSYDDVTGEMSANQPPGLMSALGGALGGLLTRRKQLTDSPHGNMPTSINDFPLFQSEAGFATIAEEEEQPYHRVVSAPPGRIGVTFVEFRGHAMVSDVAPDSPLAGWIFPSDILIAIDELHVSGMRVRDIIKVLKDRKERQRALRVISSHAMNEFTLNSSVVNDS